MIPVRLSRLRFCLLVKLATFRSLFGGGALGHVARLEDAFRLAARLLLNHLDLLNEHVHRR